MKGKNINQKSMTTLHFSFFNNFLNEKIAWESTYKTKF